MKAEPHSPTNRQILDEASVWFVDFRVGDIDAASREQFDQWLRQSPQHIRAYMEIARTYVELPALKSDLRMDTDALIAAAQAEGNIVRLDQGTAAGPSAPSAAEHHGVQRFSRASWLKPPALAASLLVTIGAGTLAAWLWLHRYPTYATEIGENRSITLPDGSTVDLNARSRLRIEFSKGERDVTLLKGQALFDVAKDPARPFIVRSGDIVVRAVGTQFDVNTGSSGTTVTVVEGRVEVSKDGAVGRVGEPANFPPLGDASTTGPTYVSAGQQLTVTAQRVSELKHADVAAATAWTQHRLIFDGTSLADVVEEFNRYNSRQIVIETSELNDFHVSGVYASTDPTSLLRFLREQPGVEVSESDNSVRITRK